MAIVLDRAFTRLNTAEYKQEDDHEEHEDDQRDKREQYPHERVFSELYVFLPFDHQSCVIIKWFEITHLGYHP